MYYGLYFCPPTNDTEAKKMNQSITRIRIGRTPALHDAVAYHGIDSGEVQVQRCDVEFVDGGMQQISEVVFSADPLEVTTMSVPAYFESSDSYEMLEGGVHAYPGSAPFVVSTQVDSVDALKGARVALPGPLTTAAVLATSFLPSFTAVPLSENEIEAAVIAGDVSAGVVENILAITEVATVQGLGERFSNYHNGLPVPCAVTCVRKDLSAEIKAILTQAHRSSTDYGLANQEKVIEFCLTEIEDARRLAAAEVLADFLSAERPSQADLQTALELLRDYSDEEEFYAANCRF